MYMYKKATIDESLLIYKVIQCYTIFYSEYNDGRGISLLNPISS